MKKDLVSITIPAYNNPEYLVKNLNSILKQSYRPVEVIISDDKSPNSLRNIVENFKKNIDIDFSIKFYEQKENLNVYWNALFVKQLLLTINGFILSGSSTTFEIYVESVIPAR